MMKLIKRDYVTTKLEPFLLSLGNKSSTINYHTYISQFIHQGFDLRSKAPAKVGDQLLNLSNSIWYPYSAKYAIECISNESPALLTGLQTTAKDLLKSNVAQVDTFLQSTCLTLHVMRLATSEKDAYIQVLKDHSYPKDKLVLPHPLCMDVDKYLRPYLHNTKLYQEILKRQSFHTTARKLINQPSLQRVLTENNYIAAKARKLSSIEQVFIDNYLWSVGVILSRAMSSNTMPMTLVPYLDFANHDQQPNAHHYYDHKQEAFILQATNMIPKDASIRISYGEARSTESFMTIYGFYGHAPNLYDTLVISVPVTASLDRTAFHRSLQEELARLRINKSTIQAGIAFGKEELKVSLLSTAIHNPVTLPDCIHFLFTVAILIENMEARQSLSSKANASASWLRLMQWIGNQMKDLSTPTHRVAYGYNDSGHTVNNEVKYVEDYCIFLDSLARDFLDSNKSKDDSSIIKKSVSSGMMTDSNATRFWISCCAIYCSQQLKALLALYSTIKIISNTTS